MLGVIYAACHMQALCGDCHYIKYHYAELHYSECHMLNVVIQSAFMLKLWRRYNV